MAINGITDEDVEFHERRIINEADREIETETSKIYFSIIILLKNSQSL
jgi:hypothetical protein